jgi:hypothetical protein
MRKYHLRPGDTLEVESVDGKICALIDRRGKNPIRIPFILDWLWQGEKFVLDYTTSATLDAAKMTGYRVIEQTETTPHVSGQQLCAGGYEKLIIGYVPWEIKPAPLSALVADRKEVLFFRDRARLSRKDWQAVELIVKAREGKLETERKPGEAARKGEEAEALRLKAEADILGTEGLETAYTLFMDAFSLDPSNTQYLEEAMKLRNRIIVRKSHMERRALYRQFLIERFGEAARSIEINAKLLSSFLGTSIHNSTSVAYFMEVLAGLAEGKYEGGKETFQKVFAALPQVLDIEKYAGKRVLGALRILYSDPDLAYITRWVMGHPAAGKEALFRRRRRKLGMPVAGGHEIDWRAVEKRRIAPIKKTGNPGDPIKELVRVVNKVVKEVNVLISGFDRGRVSLSAASQVAAALTARINLLIERAASLNHGEPGEARKQLLRLVGKRREIKGLI